MRKQVTEQAVLLGLCRVDPALDYDYRKSRPGERLASHIRRQFGVKRGHLLLADSLGRWDVFFAARLPGLGFSPASRIPHVKGLKKLDLQYGYGDPFDLDHFATTCVARPFMLATYLHVRDDLSLRAPSSSHRAVRAHLAGICRAATKSGMSAVSVRLVGWPDYAVVAAGRDLEALVSWAQDSVWSLPARLDSADQQEQRRLTADSKHWPIHQNDGLEPVFSRTFSTLCVVDLLKSDAEMKGKLHSVQMDFRIRSGADGEAAKRIAHEAKLLKLEYDLWVQPGCTDISMHPHLPPGGIGSARFISWYFRRLMPELKELITTSELRIGASLVVKQEGRYLRRQDEGRPVLPGIKLPTRFINKAEDSSAGKAVAACVQAMHRTLSSISANDGMYSSCADLHLYGLGFCEYLEESMGQRNVDLARLLEEAGVVSAHFSTAMGQRLYGSYYDLTADKPEGLIEHIGGRQKHMMALWGLQEALLEGLRKAIGLADPAFGYWAVSRAGDPGECLACGRNLFVFQVCSSSAFPARQHERTDARQWEVPCHVVGHEIGHAAHHLCVARMNDALKSGKSAEKELPSPMPELLRALQGIKPGTEAQPLRDADTGLLKELFADAYAFPLFLGADLEPYRRSVSDLAGRLRDGLRTPRAQLAYRAWAIEQCGSALAGLVSSPRESPVEAIQAYAKLSPEIQKEVLLKRFDERYLDGEAKISEGRQAEVREAVLGLWPATASKYKGRARDALVDGWQHIHRLGWHEVDFVRLAEQALVIGMYAATWSLGLRLPQEADGRAGGRASEMCRLFVNYARSGGSDYVEPMWEWAMGRLADRIGSAHSE